MVVMIPNFEPVKSPILPVEKLVTAVKTEKVNGAVKIFYLLVGVLLGYWISRAWNQWDWEWQNACLIRQDVDSKLSIEDKISIFQELQINFTIMANVTFEMETDSEGIEDSNTIAPDVSDTSQNESLSNVFDQLFKNTDEEDKCELAKFLIIYSLLLNRWEFNQAQGSLFDESDEVDIGAGAESVTQIPIQDHSDEIPSLKDEDIGLSAGGGDPIMDSNSNEPESLEDQDHDADEAEYNEDWEAELSSVDPKTSRPSWNPFEKYMDPVDWIQKTYELGLHPDFLMEPCKLSLRSKIGPKFKSTLKVTGGNGEYFGYGETIWDAYEMSAKRAVLDLYPLFMTEQDDSLLDGGDFKELCGI